MPSCSPKRWRNIIAHRPNVYAKLLAEKMEKHHARCILLNTGWSGGSYGTGQRMKLSVTRGVLHAALNGELDGVETQTQPNLKLKKPNSCPDRHSVLSDKSGSVRGEPGGDRNDNK